jgi:hypothetical protein
MSSDESFLRRWSRLKLQPPPAKPETLDAPVELPPLERLNFDSDFGAFMRAKIDEGVRRAALKTLFRDPRFNVMDGLDVYIDDYSVEDPVPPDMLEQLRHARTTLFGGRAEEEAPPEDEDRRVAEARPPDEGRPDPDHGEASGASDANLFSQTRTLAERGYD